MFYSVTNDSCSCFSAYFRQIQQGVGTEKIGFPVFFSWPRQGERAGNLGIRQQSGRGKLRLGASARWSVLAAATRSPELDGQFSPEDLPQLQFHLKHRANSYASSIGSLVASRTHELSHPGINGLLRR
jgi:hypothetical protein